MSARIVVRVVLAGSFATVLLAACGSSGSGGHSSAQPGAAGSSSGTAASAQLVAASSKKGTILTDGGRTLYSYQPDTSTASNCNAGCTPTWLPVTGTAAAGMGVSAGGLGTITRSDGSMQVTYNGHPVYEYSGDHAAGDITGDGVDGLWHLVMVGAAPASSSPAAPSTSAPARTGYGY
jgi:predicted lipoprotein with Yx(FWY)xxD motif